jgi:hypothetical protein
MKNTNLFRMALAAIIAIILAVFAFGGMGVTAYAAQAALPGDALYVVKTGMEQTRVALTHDAIEKARLNIQFADRRLDEMLRLAETGRYQDLNTAVAEFQASTARAIEALGAFSIASNPVQAREMTTLVAGVITRQSLAMNKVVASLPETAKPAVQDALTTVNTTSQMLSGSQEPSGSGLDYSGTVESMTDTAWVIDGVTYAVDAMTIVEGNIQVGDPVEFYIFTTADGSQTLWKVELASSPDGMGDDMNDTMEDADHEDGMEDDMYEDGEHNDDMYSDDDDHEYNSQPGQTTPYYDAEDNDHEDDHSGQYYEDDHEDDHGQNGGSGDHSGEHDGGDHDDGDHEDHDD